MRVWCYFQAKCPIPPSIRTNPSNNSSAPSSSIFDSVSTDWSLSLSSTFSKDFLTPAYPKGKNCNPIIISIRPLFVWSTLLETACVVSAVTIVGIVSKKRIAKMAKILLISLFLIFFVLLFEIHPAWKIL